MAIKYRGKDKRLTDTDKWDNSDFIRASKKYYPPEIKPRTRTKVERIRALAEQTSLIDDRENAGREREARKKL